MKSIAKDTTMEVDNDSTPLCEDMTPEKDGGVLKTIIKPGEGDEFPTPGCKVFVHYTGTLESGEKFDSSRDRGDVFTFVAGKESVIKGWDIGVCTMRRNEVCKLQIAPGYAYGEKGFPPKIPKNATLIFEIELLSWDDEDITPEDGKPGGVLKRLIKEGITGGGKPNLEGKVKVHLRGSYEGELFDERDVEFVIGDGYQYGIIEGVEIGICKMRRYEKAKFFIRHDYGFKDTESSFSIFRKSSFLAEGKEDFGIPADAEEVEYEVCLFDFERVKEIYEMSYDEKLTKAQDLKQRALKCVQTQQYKKALEYYERILKYININKQDSDYQRGLPFKIAGNLNAALCHLKLKDFQKAKIKAEKATKLDPGSVKGHFRLGEAAIGLSEYATAVQAYETTLRLEPENKLAKKQLSEARRMVKKHNEKEKRLYGNIFAKMAFEP